jgi:hypothetical protein
MIKKTVFIVLLFITLAANSQERRALFGIIKDTVAPIENAHIVNLNTKHGTITASNGRFKIFAKVGDTLEITSIQYQEKKYLIRRSSFSFEGFVLYLKPKIYELEEIKLKKHKLTGSLGVDLNVVPTSYAPTINAVTLGLPNAGSKLMKKVDREIYTATTSASGISLDLILNVLSGRLKMLKFKKIIVEEDEAVLLMFKKFQYVFEQSFNIKKENAYRFLYFSIADSLYNEKLLNNEFTLIQFLQNKATDFRTLKNNVKLKKRKIND